MLKEKERDRVKKELAKRPMVMEAIKGAILLLKVRSLGGEAVKLFVDAVEVIKSEPPACLPREAIREGRKGLDAIIKLVKDDEQE